MHCESTEPGSCQTAKIFSFLLLQVATILLVAGSTLTLWIPGQTVFASTSLYSSCVRGCLYNAGSSLWLIPINVQMNDARVVDTKYYHILSTPGSRSYSDILDAWADSVCIHWLILKPRSKAACIIQVAAYGSFQLMHSCSQDT